MCGCVRILRACKTVPRSWHIRYSSSSSVPHPAQGIPYTKLSIGVPKEIWQDERRLASINSFKLQINTTSCMRKWNRRFLILHYKLCFNGCYSISYTKFPLLKHQYFCIFQLQFIVFSFQSIHSASRS